MFSNVTARHFRKAFEAARDNSAQIAAATSTFDVSPAARGTRYYVASNGFDHWGYAIRADGELVYVFSSIRGKGDSIVSSALYNGAVYGDCFDGYLTGLYVRNGFGVVAKVPNWTPGEPDVVLFALDGYADRHGVSA